MIVIVVLGWILAAVWILTAALALGAAAYCGTHKAAELARRRPSLDRAPGRRRGWLAGLWIVLARDRPAYQWIRDRTCGCIWTTSKPVDVQPCPQHKHLLPQLVLEKTWEAEMPKLAHKVRRSLGPRYPERQR